jgi:predicted DNA binding protein
VSDDGSTAAIPLDAEDGDYGVLVVRASHPDALDERERVVLGSLGRAIASAINARETRRILVADSVVETEFTVRGDDLFFTALSAETGCDLTYRGSVHQEGGALTSLFSVSGSDPGAVVDAATDRDDVASAALVTEYDGGGLVEFELTQDSVVEALSGRGGKTQSMTAEDGEGRMVVEFPASADVRAVVDQLQSTYPTLDLAALRHRERPAKTKREFVASVSDDLTDRQLAALQKAYVGGFFDWPRPVTGEEVAESMGISRSTFHEHLRAAQRKLCAEFFDDVA